MLRVCQLPVVWVMAGRTAGVSLEISRENGAGGRLGGCNSLDRSDVLENYDPPSCDLIHHL